MVIHRCGSGTVTVAMNTGTHKMAGKIHLPPVPRFDRDSVLPLPLTALLVPDRSSSQ
jgi:hypothetical protein